jgi:hypothetical protein
VCTTRPHHQKHIRHRHTLSFSQNPILQPANVHHEERAPISLASRRLGHFICTWLCKYRTIVIVRHKWRYVTSIPYTLAKIFLPLSSSYYVIELKILAYLVNFVSQITNQAQSSSVSFIYFYPVMVKIICVCFVVIFLLFGGNNNNIRIGLCCVSAPTPCDFCATTINSCRESSNGKHGQVWSIFSCSLWGKGGSRTGKIEQDPWKGH